MGTGWIWIPKWRFYQRQTFWLHKFKLLLLNCQLAISTTPILSLLLSSDYSYPKTTPILRLLPNYTLHNLIMNEPGLTPTQLQVWWLHCNINYTIFRLLQSSDYTHSQTNPKRYYIFYFWLVQDYSQIILNFCIVKIITSEPHPTSDGHIHYNYSHFTPIPRLLPNYILSIS